MTFYIICNKVVLVYYILCMFQRKIVSYLNDWKNKPRRKPLILRGARQVGKTSAVLLFGEQNFSDLLHINLEKYEEGRLFNAPLSLSDFKTIARVHFNHKITPGKTLVFIDEIQNSPYLINLLRFFYEDMGELHVIAAGSLLEAHIEKEGMSLPVGRVEYAYLYPLDFFEYLEAKGAHALLETLRAVPIQKGALPPAIHALALKEFYEYSSIGGMPEAVKLFLEHGTLQEMQTVYSSLLTAYGEDIFKYAGAAQAKYIRYVLDNAPLYAGSTVTYEKFGGGNFRSREINAAFSLLEKVMLLYQVQATKSTSLPLIAQPKRPKKLLFLDGGLVNYRKGVFSQMLHMREDTAGIYRRQITEQIVGQNIIAQYIATPPELLYWARDKKEGSAEVDFCVRKEDALCGIEVKSGEKHTLRSLYRFGELVNNHQLISVSSGEIDHFSYSTSTKTLEIINLPLYLIPRLLEQWER